MHFPLPFFPVLNGCIFSLFCLGNLEMNFDGHFDVGFKSSCTYPEPFRGCPLFVSTPPLWLPPLYVKRYLTHASPSKYRLFFPIFLRCVKALVHFLSAPHFPSFSLIRFFVPWTTSFFQTHDLGLFVLCLPHGFSRMLPCLKAFPLPFSDSRNRALLRLCHLDDTNQLFPPNLHVIDSGGVGETLPLLWRIT